jgi:serine protease AprX
LLGVAAILGAAVPCISSRRAAGGRALTAAVVGALSLIAAVLAWLLVLNPGATPRARAAPAGLAAHAGSGTSGASGGSSAASGALAQVAAGSPRRQVEVIIQLRPGVSAAEGRALVRSLGGQPGLDLHIINGLSARLAAGAARRLASSPLVHAVSLNAAIRDTTLSNPTPWTLATSFDQSTGASRLWYRTTGAGIGVAVIDTGIDGDLPDFQTAQGSSTSRVVASAVIDPNTTTAEDTYGHGTAVAGLVAGNGWYRDSGDPMFGQYAGTAPDANLISIKVADDSGQATTLDAIYGLQFAVDHKADYNIRVVNLSFRSTSAESYTTDPLDAAVEQAWFHGITVLAAAGNLGSDSDAVSYAPGNDPYAIAVGATDNQGTASDSDDVEASWSSRGTTQDGFSKPDVLAPGAHIVTTLAPGSSFATACPTCVIGGDYFQLSGTSLAAPIVAGIAADLLAAHPWWTPAMVKGAIVNTAAPLPGGGSEVRATGAYWAGGGQLVSDQNLTPNDLIDPGTGSINYDAASWTAASWTTAVNSLSASWTAASWTCVACSSGADSEVSPTSASWTDVGWATNWG